MSVKFFQREIWSKNIQDGVEMEGRLVRHCTREYEGDAEYAKTVRILGVGDPQIDGYRGKVEYKEMDDLAQWLNIDIQEYFAFKVDDVDKAQSMPGLPEKFQAKAVKRLAQRRELYVGRLVAGKLLNTVNEAAVAKVQTSDNDVRPYKDYYILKDGEYKRVAKPVKADLSSYYEVDDSDATSKNLYKEGAAHVITASGKTQAAIKDAFDDALTEMRIMNNEDSGYLEIDPIAYKSFKNNLIELSTNNPELIRRGVVGMYDDYEVTRTNAIYNDGAHSHCFAHTGKAIAFAGQINEVEAMRLENTFGDGVRGLDTYGIKIISQDEIIAVKIPV